MKVMKRDRSTVIAEVRVDMLVMAERVRVWWTIPLLDTCMRKGNVVIHLNSYIPMTSGLWNSLPASASLPSQPKHDCILYKFECFSYRSDV